MNVLVVWTTLIAIFKFSSALPSYPVVGLDLHLLFDNTAASPNGSADFDGKGASFDSGFLPTGPWVYDNIEYALPSEWGTSNDNVIADGQILYLDEPTFLHELHFLFAGDADSGSPVFFGSVFTLTFTDNSTQDVELITWNWWKWPVINNGVIHTPYHYESGGALKNENMTDIFQWSTATPSELAVTSITFPSIADDNRAHIFAMAISPSVTPAEASEPALAIRRARFTTLWEAVNGTRAQVVEVTVANMLPTRLLSAETSLLSKHVVSVSGSGVETLVPGIVNRLVPGDQVTVEVLVSGSRADGSAAVTIEDPNGDIVGTSSGWLTIPLVEYWTPDADILRTHETPSWWNRAKFGIFIHWGLYSVPAFAPPSSYAEWYDWYLHKDPGPSNPTWVYHLDKYGEDIVYDDFMVNFTASKFNASEWLDLIDDAGAKYFVLVTKHHDGFALWDTSTTNRTSVALGPKRDLVRELLETSKAEKPHLHRGTYLSLPEWFNPDYAKYGFDMWPGGLAHNAFNSSELEPYTGRLEINDYLVDLQLPQMLELVTTYESEIMWCDIGGPNKALEFASEFYNNALANDRQVTMNNRCGAVPDFETPEYSTFSAIQPRAWESSEGMDPFSYGLNLQTNDSQYKNATTIIHSLVDIISKNGNYLLDIGPTAEGEIIPIMQTNLLDTGRWLKYSGRCVYDTKFWFQGSQDTGSSPDVRFLTTPGTFCIVVLSQPEDGKIVIEKRLPLLPGDEMVLLGPDSDIAVAWSMDGASGQLTIDVVNMEIFEYAWAFEVRYKVE
ncbi:glycoside hydrolase family 29 protein [Guyanagaster necrorhizus]|uniref:alpha-L-fucosidase n=1 Tax=Guyanagaster necrorhizus TaxID=856835 RepID=A0A9P8AVX6_9AGAR|nr:glycoside hydrolase family 29 protein [Guyanagaster necrorhizus MCA 3950]KAG7450034.1 glycoside hydrolase family 29 protein [Guyanagaster necrorhizus MCA 3950]